MARLPEDSVVEPAAPGGDRHMSGGKQRLLVFIVAYNAERTIQTVLRRIPQSLATWYEVEILAIDDASSDGTFEAGNDFDDAGRLPFPLKVLVNPQNQGYGGNQKLGYHYALEHGFDFVALLHGDGQYAPEALPLLLAPLREGIADAVFGSRMLVRGAARKGGMPLYKFVGNKILTWLENRALGTSLSEFHSGYRIYSCAALRKIPFDRNTNDFHFDTEIIVQLVTADQRISELPIPTYYGDEICHVNGLRYAKDVMLSVLRARAQHWGVLYDPKFDCVPQQESNSHYQLKLGYSSTHQQVLDMLRDGATVFDIGCAGGVLGDALRRDRHCKVYGADVFPLAHGVELDGFTRCDLNAGLPPLPGGPIDYVLLLDVIEHLDHPEEFIEQLRTAMSRRPDCRLIISTGNVAFLPLRIMLLLGQFNYGKRGILDLTHKRLFTFRSLRRLLEQGGFQVTDAAGIAAPFVLALGPTRLARLLARVNAAFAKVFSSVFSYQMLFVARSTPLVGQLLDRAHAAALDRIARPREPAPASAVAAMPLRTRGREAGS
jgi:glycosyltransferase involved in cell wall biosynthesis